MTRRQQMRAGSGGLHHRLLRLEEGATVAECMAACELASGCVGFKHKPFDGNKCFLRSYISLGECVASAGQHTWACCESTHAACVHLAREGLRQRRIGGAEIRHRALPCLKSLLRQVKLGRLSIAASAGGVVLSSDLTYRVQWSDARLQAHTRTRIHTYTCK